MISFEILVLSCLIDNIPVAEVNSSKFFMACIDQHLTWNDLVNDIGTKVTKNVWILARVRNLQGIPTRVLLSTYSMLLFYLPLLDKLYYRTYFVILV